MKRKLSDTSKHLQIIEFCKKQCCPKVEFRKNKVIIGGEEEGHTFFTKKQFKDFVEAAKEGKFDNI